ncbi:DUF4124 domain-containing protein [Comamonas sp. NLF-1-9]|uniref:DUF4124 domain-containing protein n=1 Tax=Comamonas sp. NLF-1-9 TaxID=2853163 RepID=UPI001C46A766|nr:DUF4124 domain-containing protein [Comamonas sp. NLF-1-9]QXL84644.1 DUF4124 domain-containing protein [Comamonas sp. NLF-1-9]
MRFFVLLFLWLSVVSAPAAAQIYKCPDPSGRTVIQQMPCEGGKTLDVRPASGPADARAAAKARGDLERMKWDNEVALAINMRKPLVGMTRSQVDRALGPPKKVNASNIQGVLYDQVIYETPHETWYVYTRDEVVTSIQHQPGIPVGRRAQVGERCPSAKEIRDAEVSASSIALSTEERVERQKAIAQMRACGR